MGGAAAANEPVIRRDAKAPDLRLLSGARLTALHSLRNENAALTTEVVTQKLGSIVPRFKAAFNRVAEQVVGMESLVKQTAFALLGREHQLIHSRAGVGKSLYARTVFGQFSNQQTFSIQLTKGTSEESVIGAISIDELKKGNVVHNTEATLVDADFGFLDEFSDANDPTLRSMLGILNERKLEKGKQREEAMLHSAIATTNYVRRSDVTEAVIDRFIYRAELQPSRDILDSLEIDRVYEERIGEVAKVPDQLKVSMAELTFLADVCEGKIPSFKIEAPTHVLVLKNIIIDRYEELLNAKHQELKLPDIYVSPRTRAKVRDTLNAVAMLRGSRELDVNDLNGLTYAIPTVGNDLQTDCFKQAISDVVKQINKQDLQTLDKLGTILELAKAKERFLQDGHEPPRTFWDNVKLFFGFTSIAKLTLKELKDELQKVEGGSKVVSEFKDRLSQQISSTISKVENKEDVLTV